MVNIVGLVRAIVFAVVRLMKGSDFGTMLLGEGCMLLWEGSILLLSIA